MTLNQSWSHHQYVNYLQSFYWESLRCQMNLGANPDVWWTAVKTLDWIAVTLPLWIKIRAAAVPPLDHTSHEGASLPFWFYCWTTKVTKDHTFITCQQLLALHHELSSNWTQGSLNSYNTSWLTILLKMSCDEHEASSVRLSVGLKKNPKLLWIKHSLNFFSTTLYQHMITFGLRSTEGNFSFFPEPERLLIVRISHLIKVGSDCMNLKRSNSHFVQLVSVLWWNRHPGYVNPTNSSLALNSPNVAKKQKNHNSPNVVKNPHIKWNYAGE